MTTETDPFVPVRIPGLSGEHAREWRQFARWAAAAEIPALPAGAEVVLAYLAEHPGTPATQRGRVSALNAAHRHARPRHPEPGAAEAVRRALNPRRGERLDAARRRADTVIARLPVTGWPDALLGRRDAVILLLASGGLSWRQIAGLSQREVALTPDEVRIGAQPLLRLPATGIRRTCPVAVFARWQLVLAHAPDPLGHLRLETLLADLDDEADDAGPLGVPAAYAEQPLLCEFDARGIAAGLVGELDPLTAETVAAITTTRLLARDDGSLTSGGDLDPSYYERGVAARWRNQPLLDELDELLDRFDDIAADLGIR